ncbi:MAG TPA: TonB-dependent receptor [Usitatibacter sp.]|nr:TonB-dependent receptor [Usitatibacter sp.]
MKNLPIASMVPLLVAAALAASPAYANMQHVADIADLDLEQLTKIKVTSASRREERVIEAPASIFVITGEDIRRSGATSLPEILRLAPNLTVARADNNQYAISARGFNNVLANKMLVLLDGRTLYTPLFSGVFWEAQDFAMDDIDRIEVISGPGATLWGANAVNGVINIITLPAVKTQGTLVRAVAGSDERGATVRYGGELPNGGNFRVYGKYWDRDNQQLESGADIVDASKRASGGFRADWQKGREQWTVQGDGYWGDIDQLPAARSISGASLLGRLTRQLGPDSSLRIQAYYDRTDREHPMQFKEALDIVDLEAQHTLKPAPAHVLIWGGGYRHARDRVENTASQAFIPPNRSLDWANVFAQDEIDLAPGLALTLGLKAEDNPYTGAEWLPNVRLAYQAAQSQLLWGALSRAVRAPSRIDREVNFPGVPPFILVGNDTLEAEVANVVEIGYRAQVSEGASLSLTGFYQDYPNLRGIAPGGGALQFANNLEGTSKGIEGWGSLRLTPGWRITGGFVFQRVKVNVKPGQLDFGGIAALGNDPEQSAQVRSWWDVAAGWEFDAGVRYMGKLPNPAVPAYTVVDARLGWRPVRDLELSLVVQNALDKEHAEWGAPNNRAAFDRSVMLRAIFRL